MSAASRVVSLFRSCNPLGPVFAKELRTTARRKRTYLLRFFYLLALLLILLVAWLPSALRTHRAGIVAQQQALAELGSVFFTAFAIFSVATMGLVGPILTATAIGSERLQKTLPVLLMTPISSWQIVSGKLWSRLLTAMTLLGLSLPVLALVRLLGSVEINQMIGTLAVALAVAIFSASIGLFFSALITRAYAVILLSYATLGFLYVFLPIVSELANGPMTRAGAMFWSLTNPFFAIVAIIEPTLASSRGGFPWPALVICHVASAMLLLICTAALVRRVGRGQFVAQSSADLDRSDGRRALPVNSLGTGLPPPLPDDVSQSPLRADDVAAAAAGEPVPPPLPAGRFTPIPMRRQRMVGDNPVIWRESHQPLLKKTWMRVVGLIAVMALMLLTYSSIGIGRSDGIFTDRPHGAIAIAADVLLVILLCVLSATCVAQEKESNTWTLLLATPLTGREIVLGKIVGVLRRLAWPLGLIFANFLFFTMLHVICFASFCIIVWVMLTFNSVWLASGVWLSLRLRKVTLAVVANLLLPLLLYLGLSLTLDVIGESTRRYSMEGWPMLYLPFGYLAIGIRGADDLGHVQPLQYGELTPGQSALALLAAGAIHLSLAYLIIRAAISRFDRIVKRAPQIQPLAVAAIENAAVPLGP